MHSCQVCQELLPPPAAAPLQGQINHGVVYTLIMQGGNHVDAHSKWNDVVRIFDIMSCQTVERLKIIFATY